MELALIIRELWSRRRLVVVGAALATMAAVASMYDVHGLFPPTLSKRQLAHSTARTQVFVDSPQSSLGDLTQQLGPLISRAGIYARILTSPAAVDAIAQHAGIPADAIYAAGPLEINVPRAIQEPTAIVRASQVAGENNSYRLEFGVNPDLPIVTILAEAPDDAKATRLANGAAQGLASYVSGLQSAEKIPSANRVNIRQLGSPNASVVSGGIGRKLGGLIFITVWLIWCVLVLLGVRFRANWRSSAAPAVEAGTDRTGVPARAPGGEKTAAERDGWRARRQAVLPIGAADQKQLSGDLTEQFAPGSSSAERVSDADVTIPRGWGRS